MIRTFWLIKAALVSPLSPREAQGLEPNPVIFPVMRLGQKTDDSYSRSIIRGQFLLVWLTLDSFMQ